MDCYRMIDCAAPGGATACSELQHGVLLLHTRGSQSPRAEQVNDADATETPMQEAMEHMHILIRDLNHWAEAMVQGLLHQGWRLAPGGTYVLQKRT
eukprot:3014240-Amphidinium_carterae.1